jgi:hypothetical protein
VIVYVPGLLVLGVIAPVAEIVNPEGLEENTPPENVPVPDKATVCAAASDIQKGAPE